MSDKGPKIAVIPSWYPPAGGEFFREHSIAVADQGAEVWVLAAIETGINDKAGLFLFGNKKKRESETIGISEHSSIFRRIPLADRVNVKLWTRQVLSMYREFCKSHGKPDLIQAHSSMWAGVAAARIKKAGGVPYILTEHRGRFTGSGAFRNLLRSWHIPLLKEAFEGADRVVTVSSSAQRRILEIAPASKPRLKVIPNMTDTSYFVPPETDLRNPECFTFVCVTSLEEIKGVDYLLKAFSVLKKMGKAANAKLVITGGGPLHGNLRRLTEQLGLNDSVSFTGYLDKEGILNELQRADSFVLPSLCEAFGIVLIEAMSCGLPVIATDSGGPAEIVNRENGVIVKAGSAEELTGAMYRMLSEAGLYDRAKISLQARQKYSRDIIAKQYMDLYKTILEG